MASFLQYWVKDMLLIVYFVRGIYQPVHQIQVPNQKDATIVTDERRVRVLFTFYVHILVFRLPESGKYIIKPLPNLAPNNPITTVLIIVRWQIMCPQFFLLYFNQV